MHLSDTTLTGYRELFPITRNFIYLNHAATSPLSTKALAAFQQYLRERSELMGDNWEIIAEKSQTLREMIGRLINTEAGRIAFVPNTNTGLNIVASGLEWREGDEILIPEMEFPSNVYPFLNLQRRGVRVRFLPIPEGGLEPERLREAITPKTKMLALSSVEFLSGYAHDLKTIGQICKEHDIWFVVDSIQGTGVIPMDVKAFQIDALANGGHKWLMWPQSFGFLYVSEHLQEKIQAAYGGWVGVEHPEEFLRYPQELSGDARRYETGGYSSAAVPAAIAALQLFFEVGIANIYEHLRGLTSIFIHGLKTQGFHLFTNEVPEVRSGIVTFYPENRSQTLPLFEYLTQKGVKLSLRENMLRISPHFYNNSADIYQTLELLKKFSK
jgi:selenocysteine lyase/cysteine desulfurase